MPHRHSTVSAQLLPREHTLDWAVTHLVTIPIIAGHQATTAIIRAPTTGMATASAAAMIGTLTTAAEIGKAIRSTAGTAMLADLSDTTDMTVVATTASSMATTTPIRVAGTDVDMAAMTATAILTAVSVAGHDLPMVITGHR